MYSIPREKLRELVQRFGKDICRDARRCEALLRDVCGSYKKEIFALASAVKEGIPAELASTSAGIPPKVLFARHTKRLHDNLGISEELCQWTVESWAYALGLVTRKDLLSETRCPSCDTAMRIPTKLFGRSAKCPKCHAGLAIQRDGAPILRLKAATVTPLGAQSNAGNRRESLSSSLMSRHDTAIIDAEIVTPSSETPEDVFRQVVRRAILAGNGLQQAHFPHLEQARASLGVSYEAAQRVTEEMVQTWTQTRGSGTQGVSSSQAHAAARAGWYVRTVSGGQYGPVDDDVMRAWISEGRITGEAFLWQEGWPQWRRADELFPDLAIYSDADSPNGPAHTQTDSLQQFFDRQNRNRRNADSPNPQVWGCSAIGGIVFAFILLRMLVYLMQQ